MKTIRKVSILMMVAVLLCIAIPAVVVFTGIGVPDDFQYHNTYFVFSPLWAAALAALLLISILMFRAGK